MHSTTSCIANRVDKTAADTLQTGCGLVRKARVGRKRQPRADVGLKRKGFGVDVKGVDARTVELNGCGVTG